MLMISDIFEQDATDDQNQRPGDIEAELGDPQLKPTEIKGGRL